MSVTSLLHVTVIIRLIAFFTCHFSFLYLQIKAYFVLLFSHTHINKTFCWIAQWYGIFYSNVYGRCVMKSFLFLSLNLRLILSMLQCGRLYLSWLIYSLNKLMLLCFHNFEFSVIVLLLLLQHMDIESNPGPGL